MSIERSDSQQTSLSAVAYVGGERRQVASASCSIRPGKGMTISVDLLDGADQLDQADQAEIAQMYAEYLAREIRKAAGLGIPVTVPGE